MKINRATAIVLGLALAVLFGLAGWGQHLHMDPEILSAVRTGAAAVFSFALALCGPLLRKDEDGDGIPDILQRILGLVLALVLFAGCGPGVAQSVASGQAAVLVATQPARFEVYQSEHTRCLAETGTLPAYRECMAPSRHLARAADSYRDALMGAQALIDAGATEGDTLAAIACVIVAARHLVDAAESANAPIPAEVRQVAALVPVEVCGG